MASTTVLGFGIALTPPLLTALRLAPLIGSTASIAHGYMEWVVTSAWLWYPNTQTAFNKSVSNRSPPTAQQKAAYARKLAAVKNIAHPAWFSNLFNTALWSVIGFNSVSTWSAIANLWLFGEGLGSSRTLYTVGLCAALAHYAFIPLVATPVAEIIKMSVLQEQGEEVDQEKSGRAVEFQAAWTRAHSLRFVTVDLLAWSSFVLAAVRVFTK